MFGRGNPDWNAEMNVVFRPNGRFVAAALTGMVLLGWTPCVEARDRDRSASGERPRRSIDLPRVGIDGPADSRASRRSMRPEVRGERTRYVIESGSVEFGNVLPDVAEIRSGAMRVRVFSDRDWVLKMTPDSRLKLFDASGGSAPMSRIAWRSPDSGGFIPVSGGHDAVIARGVATGNGGKLVVVDLELRLEPTDDLGRYGCSLRLSLESL